jgi:glycosyltransferase involved in cell wall biosynthesis
VQKTVFILTSESPETLGGVEHFVREMVRGLNARGYSTEIFHRGNSEPRWLTKSTGRLGKKLAGTLLGYWIGRNAQRNMRKDVAAVISNSDVGFYPLRGSTQLRRIHFYHGTYRGQSEAIRPTIKYSGYLYLKWWNSMVLERLSGRGKVVLTCSEQVCDEVFTYFRYDSKAMWCPINTERFKPGDTSTSRTALNMPARKPIGLFVGSMHPMKGFPIVRSVIDSLPGVHWILALRGNLPNDYAAQPNVTILKDVAHDQIPMLYCAADFSLCPSLYEPFGYVVAESLSCGTPAIASLGGASRLFLSEPPLDRLLVKDSNSVGAFVAAAQEVLRDPERYRRVVIERVRPKIHDLLATENWWRRFFQAVEL